VTKHWKHRLDWAQKGEGIKYRLLAAGVRSGSALSAEKANSRSMRRPQTKVEKGGGGSFRHFRSPLGHHGRADGRPRRPRVRRSTEPDPDDPGSWASGDPHQSQHAARFRVSRPHSHHAPRATRCSHNSAAAFDGRSSGHHDWRLAGQRAASRLRLERRVFNDVKYMTFTYRLVGSVSWNAASSTSLMKVECAGPDYSKRRSNPIRASDPHHRAPISERPYQGRSYAAGKLSPPPCGRRR
jgi:hypothetical protein